MCMLPRESQQTIGAVVSASRYGVGFPALALRLMSLQKGGAALRKTVARGAHQRDGEVHGGFSKEVACGGQCRCRSGVGRVYRLAAHWRRGGRSRASGRSSGGGGRNGRASGACARGEGGRGGGR